MNARAVLLFSRDPGGANEMIAVHELLRDWLAGADTPENTALGAVFETVSAPGAAGEKPEIMVCAKDYAHDFWRRANIEAADWPGERTGRAATEWLRRHRIAVVITGTSNRDDDTAQAIWRAAADCRIPSFAFVDHPANPWHRFRDRNGETVFPDCICVPDADSLRALSQQGIPEERIAVTGSLHLIRLRRHAARMPAAAIEAARRGWRCEGEETAVLFAGEPSREMGAAGAAYDELACLARLIEWLAAGHPVGPIGAAAGTVTVAVRPHPKDTPGKYDGHLRPRAPRVVIDHSDSSLVAMLAADLVVGMDSAMLVEAEALERPAVSLLPGHRLYGTVPTGPEEDAPC